MRNKIGPQTNYMSLLMFPLYTSEIFYFSSLVKISPTFPYSINKQKVFQSLKR